MERTDSGEMVRLSVGNWLTIGLFFAAQTIVLLAAGIGMYARLAVLEERVSRQNEAIRDIQADLKAIKVAKVTS